MIELSQSRMKRMVAIHGWSGIAMGLLLYAVVFTGAIAVFAHDIGKWSQGGTVSGAGITENIGHKVDMLSREVDPAYLEEVALSKNTAGQFRLFFHTHSTNPETGNSDTVGVMYTIDPDSRDVIEKVEGYGSDIFNNMGERALERFLVDLHVQLYVPDPWGLILTGILGLMMMVAVVSGLLMHRHLIRDLFVAPRGLGHLLSARDLHILAGTWALPFAFVLALTGAFFSFALSLGLPLVSMVAFGGDQTAMIETLIGHQESADTTRVPLASLDYIIHDATKRAGTPPTSIDIANYGTASAKVQTSHMPKDGALFSYNHIFDGPTRAYEGPKPFLGTKPSAGNVAFALMSSLHFGSFAGFASQLVWLAMGAAMSFVVISGLQLWVKRREEELVWQRFSKAVTIVGWGLPLAMAVSAVSFFVTLPGGDPLWWTPAGFFLSAAAIVLYGSFRADLGNRLRRALAWQLLFLPVLRHLTGGTSWGEALISAQVELLTIDFLLLATGLVLLYWPKLYKPAVSRSKISTGNAFEPAE